MSDLPSYSFRFLGVLDFLPYLLDVLEVAAI